MPQVRRSRPGVLHARVDGHGTYAPAPLPGRNEPCSCGSGVKAKRCHPEGLRPVRTFLEPPGEPCGACGSSTAFTMPLRHEGSDGVLLSRVCRACLERGPEAALAAILERRASPPPPPLALPPAPSPPSAPGDEKPQVEATQRVQS